MLINTLIASTRKALNWRAVLSSMSRLCETSSGDPTILRQARMREECRGGEKHRARIEGGDGVACKLMHCTLPFPGREGAAISRPALTYTIQLQLGDEARSFCATRRLFKYTYYEINASGTRKKMPPFEAKKRGNDKDDIAKRYNTAIIAKRKVLNWSAMLSSCYMGLSAERFHLVKCNRVRRELVLHGSSIPPHTRSNHFNQPVSHAATQHRSERRLQGMPAPARRNKSVFEAPEVYIQYVGRTETTLLETMPFRDGNMFKEEARSALIRTTLVPGCRAICSMKPFPPTLEHKPVVVWSPMCRHNGWFPMNLCVCLTLHHKIFDSRYKDRDSNLEKDKLRIVLAAADIIKEAIQKMAYDHNIYPDTNDMKSGGENLIPNTLASFTQKVTEKKNTSELEKLKRKCVGINHVIISVSPLQIDLAFTLHRLYGSKHLINM
ncbi:hypothetical protein PR048_018050 [Dryococelus australis]|uniref:Uncharacterized protein n=1 Tax=Dryococelus australis TaxID=614101 RepID=A0ABQ9HB71_9NEOP|nr:hypothetical protein PR048_018050 [Dryococelus australis]